MKRAGYGECDLGGFFRVGGCSERSPISVLSAMILGSATFFCYVFLLRLHQVLGWYSSAHTLRSVWMRTEDVIH